jgi:ribosomal-protein-alanine N-acetyltransferase
MIEIHTPRLLLRRARVDDLGAMHAILGDGTAMRYWSTPPHDSLDQTRDWLDGMIGAPPDGSDDFIVEHRGRVIGKAGLHRFPEIGFIFHPAHGRQGFAFEALTAVIERAFAVLSIPVIEADVDPRNAASLGLLKRLDFREIGRAERTWNVSGEWCDSVHLALHRPPG